MDSDLAQKAINAALTGNWEKAIEINSLILKNKPDDIDSLNRLARAYAEIGKINKAKETATRVLKQDPFNSIATKSLEKWKKLRSVKGKTAGSTNAGSFLEEPGKTKIVSLIHLGDAKILANIDAGDEVHLNHHGHRAGITTMEGKFVGRLPDDVSARLRKLINIGNRYGVWIKSVDKSDVKVFIREISRTPKIGDTPSFSSEKIDYISFTSPELVHDKQDIVNEVTTEDEE
jgi:tetratricopeptide (TPR) repeat protein